MTKENGSQQFEQPSLFEDGSQQPAVPETDAEAAARLKSMSEPVIKTSVEVSTDFPEERTMGDDLNPLTPEEADKLVSLKTSGVPHEKAFHQATGRKFHKAAPQPNRGKNKKRIPLAGRLATHADATSGDNFLR